MDDIFAKKLRHKNERGGGIKNGRRKPPEKRENCGSIVAADIFGRRILESSSFSGS